MRAEKRKTNTAVETLARLAEIKARVKKATPGPWVVYGDTPAEVVAPCPCCGLICTCEVFGIAGTKNPDCYNSTFIAHARTDIPALVATVDSLMRKLQLARKRQSSKKGGKK